jgi:hypothetical protein
MGRMGACRRGLIFVLFLEILLALSSQDALGQPAGPSSQPSTGIVPTATAPAPTGARWSGGPATDDEVYAALRRTIPEFTFQDSPLDYVLSDLRRRTGLNVHVQSRELDREGIQLDKPVSITLRNLPAGRVLRAVLDAAGGDAQLQYEVQGGAVVVSTDAALARRMVLRTYLVRDLLPAVRTAAEPLRRQSIGVLVNCIRDTVFPDSWEENGGEGKISDSDGILVVRNGFQVHDQLRALLDALRTVPTGGSVPVPSSPSEDPLANAIVHSALQRVLPSVAYDGVPLLTVLEKLGRELNVNILPMVDALQAEGLEMDTPVSLHLQNVTAERVLEQIVKGLRGDARPAFDVDDGIVIVASDAYLERHKLIRVYHLAAVAPTPETRDQAIQMLQNTVEPDSWLFNGGSAQLVPFNDRLIVLQTPRAHRQIEELLRATREGMSGHRPTSRP